MHSTEQLNVTLSSDVAEAIKAKVAQGEYETESDAINSGLRTFLDRERAVEQWLRDEVIPVARTMQNRPEQALTARQVREKLARKRHSRHT